MRALFAAVLLLAPGSAWAASGDIGCIETKLGPDAMQRIGRNIVAAADSGKDFGSALDTDRDSLLAARQQCRVANNWSPTAVQAAVSYFQGRATKLGADAALKADGLDSAKLAASYAALPVPDRKSLIAQASPGALAAARTVGANPRVRRHAMLYFAALAAIEFYPAEFSAA